MRFEEAWGGWQSRRLTQEEAAGLLGVCERTFRRYVDQGPGPGQAPRRGRRRERAPVAGMMLHQSLPPRRRGSTATTAPSSGAPCTNSAWR